MNRIVVIKEGFKVTFTPGPKRNAIFIKGRPHRELVEAAHDFLLFDENEGQSLLTKACVDAEGKVVVEPDDCAILAMKRVIDGCNIDKLIALRNYIDDAIEVYSELRVVFKNPYHFDHARCPFTGDCREFIGQFRGPIEDLRYLKRDDPVVIFALAFFGMPYHGEYDVFNHLEKLKIPPTHTYTIRDRHSYRPDNDDEESIVIEEGILPDVPDRPKNLRKAVIDYAIEEDMVTTEGEFEEKFKDIIAWLPTSGPYAWID